MEIYNFILNYKNNENIATPTAFYLTSAKNPPIISMKNCVPFRMFAKDFVKNTAYASWNYQHRRHEVLRLSRVF